MFDSVICNHYFIKGLGTDGTNRFSSSVPSQYIKVEVPLSTSIPHHPGEVPQVFSPPGTVSRHHRSGRNHILPGRSTGERGRTAGLSWCESPRPRPRPPHTPPDTRTSLSLSSTLPVPFHPAHGVRDPLTYPKFECWSPRNRPQGGTGRTPETRSDTGSPPGPITTTSNPLPLPHRTP